ncbi:MAG: hypothetical protein GX020_00210 [Firmicutes bacterium]|jgi:hypothetical protein|nr:hypothetical protein [Bacillota bacterium]
MPSKEQLEAVGQTCSEYVAVSTDENLTRSCETCQRWGGEEVMCQLDIFLEQLVNLDQT